MSGLAGPIQAKSERAAAEGVKRTFFQRMLQSTKLRSRVIALLGLFLGEVCPYRRSTEENQKMPAREFA